MKAKKFKKVCFSVVAVIIVVLLVINVLCGMFSRYITNFLCSTPLSAEARAEGEALATQIEEEGIVMVRNQDDTLPLSESVTKVNVFGWAATQWIVGGSGSGRVLGDTNSSVADTDFLQALNDYGIEYNTKITDMYKNFKGDRPHIDVNNSQTEGTLHQYPKDFSVLYEPQLSAYTSEMLEYDTDTAIVVLGRITGESNDCPQVQYKVNTKGGSKLTDESRTYLDISTEEEALLEFVAENHENVIVLINSTNTMNLSFLEDIANLDACLVVGATGINAANAIPKVLYGEISPSGRLSDTYAYDFTTNSSYANAGALGVGSYVGSNGYYPANGTTNPNVSVNNDKYTAVSYLDYSEGIYMGYKWYETADAEGFWSSDFANQTWGVNGYDEVVQYPFGYGLSYTEFEWEVMSISSSTGNRLTAESEITVSVKVTNVGDYAGKDVVQLYFTPQYNGTIEKSYVTLCAFEKTLMLYPESEADAEKPNSMAVDLTFKASDMASYDSEGFKIAGGGYVLEQGEYEVKVMTDCHNALADEKNITGETSAVFEVANDINDPTGEGASNLFVGDNADNGVSIDGTDTNENITYLSRADFEGTFPAQRTADRAMHQLLKDSNLYDGVDVAAWQNERSDVAMPTTGEDSNLRLYDENGVITELGLELGNNKTGYDDERWELVLNQITVDEMKKLTMHGYIHEESVASVGKPETNSVDGPTQVGSFNVDEHGVGYPNATVLAQSWNKELSKSFGAALGEQAIGLGYEGLYATGLNLHRSPFGGRNYEYYSEDSYLSGEMCANTVKGALSKGVYTYIKHFVVYEQESQRDSIYHWMTEQTLREVYLKPFKIVIDEADATALMSSYGRIGSCWTGGSQALLTDLLRDEWGFKGAVITDYADHWDYMNYDQMIRAGGDLWMDGWQSNGSAKYDTSSAAVVSAMRTATKHLLYMGVNAQYMATQGLEGYTPRAISSGTPWWVFVLVGFDAVVVAGCAIWVVFAVRKKDPVENVAEVVEQTKED